MANCISQALQSESEEVDTKWEELNQAFSSLNGWIHTGTSHLLSEQLEKERLRSVWCHWLPEKQTHTKPKNHDAHTVHARVCMYCYPGGLRWSKISHTPQWGYTLCCRHGNGTRICCLPAQRSYNRRRIDSVTSRRRRPSTNTTPKPSRPVYSVYTWVMSRNSLYAIFHSPQV